MKIGILKAFESFELSILKYDTKTKKYNLVVAYTLNKNNPLGDCKGKLLEFKLDELWFVPMATILNDNISDKKIDTYSTGSSTRDIVVNNNDVNKIKSLCEETEVACLKIFNIYNIIKEMVKEPTIFVADYDSQVAYLYYTKEGLKDHRIWREFDANKLQTLMKQKGVTTALPLYNNVLNSTLAQRIVNWESLEMRNKITLAPVIGAILIKPACEFKTVNHIMIEVDKTVSTKSPSPIKAYNREAVKTIVKPKDTKEIEEHKEPKSKLGLGLNIVGASLSILLAGCLVANKQLPKDIEFLQGKQEELVALVEPKQNTIDYFDKFLELQNKENVNFDEKTVSSIKGVEVDGILAEIKLQKSEVGIVVYLKDAAAIESYTTKLGEIFEITQVANKGTVSLENTSLTKFIINGIR